MTFNRTWFSNPVEEMSVVVLGEEAVFAAVEVIASFAFEPCTYKLRYNASTTVLKT